MDSLIIEFKEFLKDYIQNSKHFSWFLGAGSSRSAGMPTATDIIWDLKRRLYCLEEDQVLNDHDVNKDAVRNKIQSYMDSKGYPRLWDDEEYSFYFEKSFGNNYAAQQKYLNSKLDTNKISLNIGHRILAALMLLNHTKIVFTTNFDEVIETAYSKVAEKNLTTFHLEGSYAATTALNDEAFPFYCKIHGDFRYQSIKNLAQDLKSNDMEIQKCFMAAAARYGIVVSGYSGRDSNVMEMFQEAVRQNNAFPHGLYWTTYNSKSIHPEVINLIKTARTNGVKANIVISGTFDETLLKIWRQVDEIPNVICNKVKPPRITDINVPTSSTGSSYPILRTNALPILELPSECGSVNQKSTLGEIKSLAVEKGTNAIITYTDSVLFWGDAKEILELIPHDGSAKCTTRKFENPVDEISRSTIIKNFYERCIAHCLSQREEFLLRVKRHVHYIVVRPDKNNSQLLEPLKKALSNKKFKCDYLCGNVKSNKDTKWSECVSVQIEIKDNKAWLMLRPDIWINPLKKRADVADFLRDKKRFRYNNTSFEVLSAWITLLFGNKTPGGSAPLVGYEKDTNPCRFTIGLRSAYSRGSSHEE